MMIPIYDEGSDSELIECSDCPCDAQVMVEIDGKSLPFCGDCAEAL